jgi:hypothetical protein
MLKSQEKSKSENGMKAPIALRLWRVSAVPRPNENAADKNLLHSYQEPTLVSHKVSSLRRFGVLVVREIGKLEEYLRYNPCLKSLNGTLSGTN